MYRLIFFAVMFVFVCCQSSKKLADKESMIIGHWICFDSVEYIGEIKPLTQDLIITKDSIQYRRVGLWSKDIKTTYMYSGDTIKFYYWKGENRKLIDGEGMIIRTVNSDSLSLDFYVGDKITDSHIFYGKK